jgi:hypothetical protein
MIHDVDATLQALLAEELGRVPGCPVRDPEQITFSPPAVAEAYQDGEARVNLFLHDVRENLDERDGTFYRRPGVDSVRGGIAPTVGLQRARVKLNLMYLVTAHAANDPLTEHRLLSDALGVLLTYLAVDPTYHRGSLATLGANSVLLAVAQPEHREDPSSLWQVLGGTLKPSLALQVTAPFNPFGTVWHKVVREAVFGTVSNSTGAGEPGRPVEVGGQSVSAAGIVVDQGTQAPVGGVQVQIEGRPTPSRTDARGIFVVTNLPSGSHTLHFTHPGYAPLSHVTTAPPVGRADLLEPLVIALRPSGSVPPSPASPPSGVGPYGASSPLEWRLIERERRFDRTLSGRLFLPDGSPAAFVPVRCGGQQTATDAEGYYRFTHLAPQEAPPRILAQLPNQGEVEVQTDGDGRD